MLGYFARVSLGAENNLKSCAVTDSKVRLFERGLGAASARHHFQDFQRIITHRMNPEIMCDF